MRCRVTEDGEPFEVAHIYPYNLRHREESLQYHFWMRLQFIWSDERVSAWARAVYGLNGTETLTNLLTLSSTVHKLWELSRFALKPLDLSADMNSGFPWTHSSKTANTWLLLISRLTIGSTTMMPVRWTVSFSTVLQRRRSAPVMWSLFEPRIQSITHSRLGTFLTCSGSYIGW